MAAKCDVCGRFAARLNPVYGSAYPEIVREICDACKKRVSES